MAKLFEGKTLWRKSGDSFNVEQGAAEKLKGKVVALYFSAHWCPPCRGFTPILKDFYEELADSNQFEVVFVTFDRTEHDLKEYLKEAHGDWLYLNYGDKTIQELSELFGVSGIPALIIVKPDGSVANKSARGDVQGKGKPPVAVLKDWKAACGL